VSEPEVWGNGCECWVTPERDWTRYGSAVEPGSQVEWNPECPKHPATPEGGVDR
jgi:hypothetical protein